MVSGRKFNKPDVLFVGMTAPKQEKWSAEHKDKLDANVICSIGALYDFNPGTLKRPGGNCVKLGLEWFVRLLKEPKRLRKRYIYYGPTFLYIILKQKDKRYFRPESNRYRLEISHDNCGLPPTKKGQIFAIACLSLK